MFCFGWFVVILFILLPPLIGVRSFVMLSTVVGLHCNDNNYILSACSAIIVIIALR
jgi:hypothetical protein